MAQDHACVICIAIALSAGAAEGQVPSNGDNQVRRSFELLLQESQKLSKEGKVRIKKVRVSPKAAPAKAGKNGKERSGPSDVDVSVVVAEARTGRDGDPPTANTTEVKEDTAFEIWAEIVEGPLKGRFVNLSEYQWHRKERFILWMKAAVPVQLSVGQVFPKDNAKCVQVLPRPEDPLDLTTIPAGRDVKFPIGFIMDDDNEDEYMSILVVRADSGQLPINNPTQTQADSGDDDLGSDGVLRSTTIKLAEFHQRAVSTDVNVRSEFKSAAAIPKTRDSALPRDVAVTVAGTNGRAEHTIRLKKSRQ